MPNEGDVDVVAHEPELVARIGFGGMDAELGGRQGEDEPTPAGIDRRKLQHVAKECPSLLGVAGIEDRMDSVDHEETSSDSKRSRLVPLR